MRKAELLLGRGRDEEAVEAYRELLARDPDLPEAWYNLAYLLRRTRRFEEALGCYAEALKRGIERPEEVHLNRSAILAGQLRRHHAAIAELRSALRHAPDYLDALLNLGNLHEDRGDRAKAEAAYRRALDLDPENVFALSRLAGVKKISRVDDPIIDRLRAALARSGAPEDKAELGFALGQALDSAQAYDEAFAVYAVANEAARQAGDVIYDRKGHERLIDRIIAAFPEPASEPRRDGPRPPIFICGMFRSGSTLAEQILASHSQVKAGGELDLVPALIAGRLRPYPEAAAAADPAAIARLRDAYREGLRTVHPEAAIVTDKRPDNFLHIGLIKRLFPDARIVHSVRDPLDNCLSVYFLHLDPRMRYAFDLEDIAHWHHQYRRLMAHWKCLYPDDIHDFDYDRLVADPKPAIAALLDFCGLGWEDACLSFHRIDSAVRTASVWQVREPLYSRSSGRWRNYAGHLERLEKALAD